MATMTSISLKIALRCCALAAVALTSGGCVAAIGTGRGPAKATVGQQLTDLHKARQTGAMTEAEYQDQRRKALAGE